MTDLHKHISMPGEQSARFSIEDFAESAREIRTAKRQDIIKKNLPWLKEILDKLNAHLIKLEET